MREISAEMLTVDRVISAAQTAIELESDRNDPSVFP